MEFKILSCHFQSTVPACHSQDEKKCKRLSLFCLQHFRRRARLLYFLLFFFFWDKFLFSKVFDPIFYYLPLKHVFTWTDNRKMRFLLICTWNTDKNVNFVVYSYSCIFCTDTCHKGLLGCHLFSTTYLSVVNE